MSHPLLTSAIENAFVPLAVNNRPGTDGGLLERYEEPQYNNPVVRYFAPGGEELLERRDRVWDSAETAERMVAALEAGDYEVPAYLQLARAELSERLPERIVFAMSCFWEGQAALGGGEGVLVARPGFAEGREVVEVLYDARTITAEALVRVAKQSKCTRRVFADGDALADARGIVGDVARPLDGVEVRVAPASDDLVYLKRSPLSWLPLTPLQSLRVNASLASPSAVDGAKPEDWLSPAQRALLPRLRDVLSNDAARLEPLADQARGRRPQSLDELAAYRAALLELL